MQNLPSQASILVIGAGPTGLSLAAAAAQKGVSDLLIFEARSSTAREAFKLASRATVVHAGTLDEIEQTLGGVADEVRAKSTLAKHIKAPSTFSDVYPLLSFDGNHSFYPIKTF